MFEFGYEAHDDLRVSRGTSKKCAAKEETDESYRLAGLRVTARKMREGAQGGLETFESRLDLPARRGRWTP